MSNLLRTTMLLALLALPLAASPAAANPIVDDTYGILNCAIGISNHQLGLVASLVNTAVTTANNAAQNQIQQAKCRTWNQFCATGPAWTTVFFPNEMNQVCRTTTGAVTFHIGTDGRIIYETCGGGWMHYEGMTDLYFPGNGCQADYSSMAARSVLAITGNINYTPTGVGTVCGKFIFYGGYVGNSQYKCLAAEQAHDVPIFVRTTGAREFRVLWQPDVTYAHATVHHITLLTT